jgi:hypothetical protein
VRVRTRLRFVFPHVYMRRREKFGFHIRCRDPDVARAGSGALACRRTNKADYRPRQNYALVYSAWQDPIGGPLHIKANGGHRYSAAMLVRSSSD